LIANGTTREQEILRGTIATLADIAAARRPRPPALLIVGEVAGLSERLAWFHSNRSDVPATAEEAADYPETTLGRLATRQPISSPC
jgi:uroporphyrin-III C-methyltransferase/precorrin-2 dehydrogenase/sirohydrochlorin ferrochelatase